MTLRSVRPAAQRLKFFLEPQLLALELSEFQVIEGRISGNVLNHLVEISVAAPQLTDTGFNGHRVSLHVCFNVGKLTPDWANCHLTLPCARPRLTRLSSLTAKDAE